MAQEEPVTTTAPQSRRELLIDAYALLLLDKPTVKGLQPGEKDRERLAHALALRDVERFAHALLAAGLRVVTIPPPVANAGLERTATAMHNDEAPLLETMTRGRLWGEWNRVLSKSRSLRLNTPILPHTATDAEVRAQIREWRRQVERAEEREGVR